MPNSKQRSIFSIEVKEDAIDMTSVLNVLKLELKSKHSYETCSKAAKLNTYTSHLISSDNATNKAIVDNVLEMNDNSEKTKIHKSILLYYKPYYTFDEQDYLFSIKGNLASKLNYAFSVQFTSEEAMQLFESINEVHPQRRPQQSDMVIDLGFVKNEDNINDENPHGYEKNSMEYFADKKLRYIGTPLGVLVDGKICLDGDCDKQNEAGVKRSLESRICKIFAVDTICEIGARFQKLVSKGEIILPNDKISELRYARLNNGEINTNLPKY